MHSRFVAAPPSAPSPKIPHRNRTIELEIALKAYKAAQDLKAERSKLCEKAGSERFFLVVQSIFKNEADVLAEWIEHHRWQGVEHFFLVDNNSSDNFAQVLAPYAQYVTLRTEPKPHQQVRHINTFRERIRNEARWVMNIDVDEFVYAHPSRGFSSIPEYLRMVEAFNCTTTYLSLYWHMFGSSGHIQQPPSIRTHFTRSAAQTTWSGTKYIARARAVRRMDVHKPIIMPGLINPWQMPDPLPLVLNHYAILSRERFARVKMTRGDVDAASSESLRTMIYFKQYDRIGNEVDNFELKRLVESSSIDQGRRLASMLSERCELRIAGSCPGYERPQYRSWFPAGEWVLSSAAGREACRKKRASWQRICGGAATVEERLSTRAATVEEQAALPSQQSQRANRINGGISCSRAFEKEASTIYPTNWPDVGIFPASDAANVTDSEHGEYSIKLMIAGANASRHRHNDAAGYVRRQAARLSSQHEALLCRWRDGAMQCRRERSPLFGPPAQSEIRAGRVAVIMAGGTRSFATSPMQEYLRRVIGVLRATKREVVLFAVLSLADTQRMWGERKFVDWSLNNATELEALVKALTIDTSSHGYRFLAYTSPNLGVWRDTARQVCTPALRKALSPAYANKAVPCNYGFQRRVVALDQLLQYEVETRTSFEHVLLMRPDVMSPPLLDFDAVARMWSVREAVVTVNDQIAVAPRGLAGYLLISGLFHRVVYGSKPDVWAPKIVNRLSAALLGGLPGSLCLPTTLFAYYGVLFAGSGLEFSPRNVLLSDEEGVPNPFAMYPHHRCPVSMLRQLPPRPDLASSEGYGGIRKTGGESWT